MNIYAEIIAREARRRGIQVEVIADGEGLFRLSYNGQHVVCRESLTDRTPATTFWICQDKRVTSRVLAAAGFRVPRQCCLGPKPQQEWQRACQFRRECHRLVVKPANGEQGAGITVDVATEAELRAALCYAAAGGDAVLLEEFVPGRDLRLIVIDHRFTAAIERRPAAVRGDGASTVRQLVMQRNEELAAQTSGEAQIPLDSETERVLQAGALNWNTVLEPGQRLAVRKTANFHTGGTITDVTDQVSSALRAVAESASRTLAIPVVGFDFLVPTPADDEYVIVEANERPGLANHEPQPVVERFVDFLFPTLAAGVIAAGSRAT